MPEGLDVIIIDDEAGVCQVIKEIVERFYTWGDVYAFTDVDEAMTYCLGREVGVAVFIVVVFLRGDSGFAFLDAVDW